MSPLDDAVLAERASMVRRHLDRVAGRLPASSGDLHPATDVSDAVVLHLWQATQIVIDLVSMRFSRLWLRDLPQGLDVYGAGTT